MRNESGQRVVGDGVSELNGAQGPAKGQSRAFLAEERASAKALQQTQ